MTPRTRIAVCFAAAAASALVLTGCLGIETDGLEPTPTAAEEAPSPMPTPEPTPLTIPEHTAGELSRVVYTKKGADGVPTSTGEINAAPLVGVEYTVEAVCIPLPGEPRAEASFAVSTTDDAHAPLMSGTTVCDGDPWLMSGEIVSDTPPQVSFTATDGVDEAYVRILPTEELLEQG